MFSSTVSLIPTLSKFVYSFLVGWFGPRKRFIYSSLELTHQIVDSLYLVLSAAVFRFFQTRYASSKENHGFTSVPIISAKQRVQLKQPHNNRIKVLDLVFWVCYVISGINIASKLLYVNTVVIVAKFRLVIYRFIVIIRTWWVFISGSEIWENIWIESDSHAVPIYIISEIYQGF
jgi:hypothetical protein